MESRKYNLRKDKIDCRDLLFKARLTAIKLPSSVDLRAKMPVMWDQGQLGSCQSHAIDAIVSYLHNNDFDPSRLFTYYNVRLLENDIEEDCGGDLRDTLKAVNKFGVCDSKYCKYDISKFKEKPSNQAYTNAKKDEIYSYHRVLSLQEAKLALSEGHLVLIGVVITESFESDECMQTGIILTPTGEELGGHAMVIVGYDDNLDGGSFIIRNSWGTGVGIEGTGYFQASYDVLKQILMDMWVVIK